MWKRRNRNRHQAVKELRKGLKVYVDLRNGRVDIWCGDYPTSDEKNEITQWVYEQLTAIGRSPGGPLDVRDLLWK